MPGKVNNDNGLYYPLTKMNFLVTVTNVDGVAAFSEVTGIDASVDVIEFRQGNANSLSPIKIPGLVKHGNLTLKMGYTRNQAFKTWVQNCVSERRKQIPRETVTIELIDINKEGGGAPNELVAATIDSTLVWQLKEAWVCKYTGPDLNASTSEVAIESIEIAFEEMTIPN